MDERGLPPAFSEQPVAKVPEIVPSAEPPKAPVAPAPETPPVSAAIAPQVNSVGFESGMAGGEGEGTAATNKSEGILSAEVGKYMALATEALSLPEGDPAREAKMLELMNKIEAAKASGELGAAVIGESRDRAIILEKPAQSVIREPAHIPMTSEERIGLRVGDMETVRDTYLAINRKGLTGLVVTKDQQIIIDPNAELFTQGGKNFAGEEGVAHFRRNFDRWLGDCQRDAKQAGVEGQWRINALMQRTAFQEQPQVRMPAEKGYAQPNQNYMQEGNDWVDSDTVKPDGLWASFITKDDDYINTPTVRSPRGRWFDVGGRVYEPVQVNNTETMAGVLRANMKSAETQQQIPQTPLPQVA